MTKPKEIELTILMPCLDEAETIEICISKANEFISKSGVSAEILIADNGSTDGSQEMAKNLGARVIDVKNRGYGNALIAGINSAKGDYIIMGDADDSYDFLSLSAFVEKLREGNDLVMGNRFLGGIKKGAMPPLHRYLGNPVLSFIGKLLFKIKVGDFHCGMRGFNTKSIKNLGLVCGGMEFASEMVVKASLNNLKMVEVPTTLSPDGRSRPPHLRSWRDGWRHLRFLLIFSPKWLFLLPGIILFISGLVASALLTTGPFSVGPVSFDIHTLLFSAAAVITGTQLISFSVLGKILGSKSGLLPKNEMFESAKRVLTVEKFLIIGGIIFITGLATSVLSLNSWQASNFGSLNPSDVMRKVIPSITMMVCGIQVFFSAFFAGLIDSFSLNKKT